MNNETHEALAVEGDVARLLVPDDAVVAERRPVVRAHHPVALTPPRRGRVGPQRSEGRSKARTRASNGLVCAELCRSELTRI